MPMINCPECNKEISDSASTCPNCGKPNANAPAKVRPVGILLGIGIFLAPLIFAWFTLRKGHTTKAKVISFVWLALSTVLFFIASGTQDGTTSAISSSSQSAVTAKPEEVMEVQISKILSDYENNEVGADNTYKDKKIQVKGIITDVKKDIMDNLYVTLNRNNQLAFPQIQAFFDDSMNDQLAQLQKGRALTIVCRIDGLMMNVVAEDCTIKQ